MSDHNPSNTDLDDRAAVEQVLAWLQAHGIERRLVPSDPRASMADGQLTIQLWATGPNGAVKLDPERPNELMRQTVTVPIVVAPPPIVEAWLAPRCPTCGR